MENLDLEKAHCKTYFGILKPSKGQIKINNKIDIHENLNIWQNKISYIPQDIFVFEDNWKKYCFGEIIEKEIHNCLKQVGLLEFAVNCLIKFCVWLKFIRWTKTEDRNS